MLFASPLSSIEIATLEAMRTYHPLPTARVRAHALILSNKGYQVQEIADIHEVCRQSVSSWIRNWESEGLCGLVDKPRSGRPKEIEIDEQGLIEKINENPRSLKKIVAELEKELGITISYSYLRKLCKKAGYCWKRIRKSLKSKRNEEEFARSKELIEELVRSAAEKEIDVFYFDESGFTLEPCIPYAWQPQGESIEVPSSKSRRLNVLGFMNRLNESVPYVFEGAIDSEVVIKCFDDFSNKIEKTTVVLVDNSPLHTSINFDEKTKEWLKNGLIVVPIARYSPELNLIEILWKKN
jgi:transposase